MGINDSGRKKLVIVKVLEKRQVGEFEVQEFTAHIDGEEANAKHGVWSKALYEYIIEDSTIDCDVVTKKSDKVDPEGNPYWNRKVTQIYVDNQPVAAKKSFVGGFRQDSPEQRRSIERQVALKQAVEFGKLLLQGSTQKFSGADILIIAEGFYQWISIGTMPPMQTTKTPSTTNEKPKSDAPKAPSPSDSPTRDKTILEQAMSCQTAKEFYDFAREHFTAQQIMSSLGISKISDIKDIPAAAKTLFHKNALVEKAKELGAEVE